MSPSGYDAKRSFESTPEPVGEGLLDDVDPLTAPVGRQFVIHQHHATALHHDLRLEMLNGDKRVLVSWAVPKGLPRSRGRRHLAIHVEDHPIGYATFSGSIPAGEYGAGEVRIFDEGTYEMVDRSDERITFRLEGDRLSGVWHLVHTGPENGRDQWLAIMSQDLRPAGETQPDAEPMLATLTGAPFDDPEWLFEPKWDGIRAIAVCGEDTRLLSRNGRDITMAYPELHRIHNQVVALDAMLDGEIVAFDDGAPSFQLLQQRMHLRDERKIEQTAKRIPVVYMVFDLLYLDGIDLTGRPLTERRALLEEAIVPSDVISLSPATEGAGIALFEAAAEQGLEGVMAKRGMSTYQPGSRTDEWLKMKVVFDADVVIVGWTEGEGQRSGRLGSLAMAVYDGDDLRYVGNVGTGFDRASLGEVEGRLATVSAAESPLPSADLRGLGHVHWVSPSLVARVEHRQLTAAGRLRAPSFQGLREDKLPRECTWEQLVSESRSITNSGKPQNRSSNSPS